MKWMPMVSVCATAIGLVPAAHAQTSGVLHSIDDLVNAALQRNGDYLAAEQRRQEAQALLRQAGVRPSSTVEIEAANGGVLGSAGEANYTAGFFQPIEAGRKRDRRINATRIGIELVQAELDERKRQLLFDVQARYVEAAAARDRVAIVERIFELN